MEANQILQANLLDIIFENRNKQYGAYELRKNYSARTGKALAIALSLVSVLIIMSSYKQSAAVTPVESREGTVVKIIELNQPTPEVPVQQPAQKPVTPKPSTIDNVTPLIVPDILVTTTEVPTVDEQRDSKPGTTTETGEGDVSVPTTDATVGNTVTTGVVETTKAPDEIATVVDVKAKYLGDWIKFLTRNLNGSVGVDNGAPAGQYKVMIEFVIDTDGSMSMIKPLTNHGYGLEQEAVRVIKKANKWTPALQKSTPVKAFHRQVITFEITAD